MIRKKLAALGAASVLGVTGATVAAPAQAAEPYINVKNSVNSDHYIRVYRDFDPDREVHYLSPGENWVLYNGDDRVRIKIYQEDSIDSYQYYYGGTWHACHDWASNDITNPTNDYYNVTIRTFYSGDCDGRN